MSSHILTAFTPLRTRLRGRSLSALVAIGSSWIAAQASQVLHSFGDARQTARVVARRRDPSGRN